MMLFSLIAASALASQPLPPMKAQDPTAQLQGDGGSIKFDPACRDFTVETVKSVPDCAARLEKGETAPSLAIATQTLGGMGPTGPAQAVAILERAIRTENHPAAHYLLGMLLSTGQAGIVPRYAEAVKHLQIASDRGNPAASDLLATLLVQGKGTARDIPRAVALYKKAMADGFLNSATSLGMLYLNGRYQPADVEYGARLLEEAAKLGERRAASLAPMARATNVHNFQLFPAADPAKVKIREFGTFDNPEIPPNFGFDEAFQALHYRPYDDSATLAELERTARLGPTPYLYELARRRAAAAPADALRLYILARTRMLYDASRCTDPSALGALRAWDTLIAPDFAFVLAAVPADDRAKALALALADEAPLSGDAIPWWVCRSSMTEMTNAVGGKVAPLSLKPVADWPKLREDARSTVSKAVSAIK
ncbi:MAG: sel1 repeat family protein [Sphingobium sp.]|nr:sel1 repeat family protein [Sphingobium sp.]